MTISLLPDTAPFSTEQRAWLNGFFAGLLGLDSNGNGTAVLAPAVAANGHARAATAPAAVEAEEFPWHDAALPIDERLKLAEGRPVERKLMAAMAQLDCGACGYLCQTYSEAIASGEEKDLTRCSPGGKETARALKEIVASRGTSTTNGVAMTHIVAGDGTGAATTNHGPPMTSVTARAGFNRANPFPAKLIDCRPLNGQGSSKDTRHVMISLEGSGLAYKPGDALGVFPENCPELVEEVLHALGVDGRLDLRSMLIRECALARPSDDLLELLVESATDPDEADHLTRLRDGDDAWIDTADVLDVLRRHPSVRPDVEEFVAVLARLQPRLYSISSSPRAHPEEVHLTVGVVRYPKDDRQRLGVASTFLAERVRAGEEVRVFVHPSHRFQLPDHGDSPMIMVGPGTGIAPFRAFLEERQEAGAGGKNWLFYGDQCRATDFLYEEELRQFQQAGLLTRLDVAFSRDQDEKVYVQHRMLERAADLWGWLEEGAHFYVCGDAKRMASDVDRALHQVVAGQGGLSAEAAKAYVAKMVKAGRYQRDVY